MTLQARPAARVAAQRCQSHIRSQVSMIQYRSLVRSLGEPWWSKQRRRKSWDYGPKLPPTDGKPLNSSKCWRTISS
jgi:hypothetical protein